MGDSGVEQWVKPSSAMCHLIRMPDCVPDATFSTQRSANAWGKEQKSSFKWFYLSATRKPKEVLASAQFSPGHCSHLGSEGIDGTSLIPFLFVTLSNKRAKS